MSCRLEQTTRVSYETGGERYMCLHDSMLPAQEPFNLKLRNFVHGFSLLYPWPICSVIHHNSISSVWYSPYKHVSVWSLGFDRGSHPLGFLRIPFIGRPDMSQVYASRPYNYCLMFLCSLKNEPNVSLFHITFVCRDFTCLTVFRLPHSHDTFQEIAAAYLKMTFTVLVIM